MLLAVDRPEVAGAVEVLAEDVETDEEVAEIVETVAIAEIVETAAIVEIAEETVTARGRMETLKSAEAIVVIAGRGVERYHCHYFLGHIPIPRKFDSSKI